MPPTFCLLPQHVDAFKAKVKSGEFDSDKLIDMGSAGRHAAFAEIMGEANAVHVNAQFESKLLLANEKAGIANWIEKYSGAKPAAQRDMLSRVARMEKVLEPAARADFFADLAHQKLGVGVTMEQAGKVSELGKATADAKTAGDWDAYVTARVAFREYVGGLEADAHKLTTPQKVAAFVRGGALSWPTTLVKLSAAATSRFIATPITDATALGLAKVFPDLAKGAPRYGTTSLTVAMKSEAAAQAAAWTDGIIDSGRMLQNKASRLDLMHGDNAVAHAWHEYAGSIHGALKEPVKRAEYARSLYRRTAEAEARGENVQDITVKMRLSTEAFTDAQSAISMQDNVISKGWNAGLRSMEAVDKKTGKANPLGSFLGMALRMDTPVMKAPTNIVLEAGDWIGGLLTGGTRTAWAYAHGIEDLAPIERDAIIRQMSRGTVGAALMTLYYFKHDLVQFGGFYRQGDKRGPHDVAEGAARIGNLNIPKILLHHPAFDALQYAATMARVTDQQGRKKGDHGLASATAAAAFGLLDELPVMHTASDAVRIIHEQGGVDYSEQKLASEAVPGVVQWVAKKVDHDRKVKPTGLVQHLEANLPGLRSNVPEKKRK